MKRTLKISRTKSLTAACVIALVASSVYAPVSNAASYDQVDKLTADANMFATEGDSVKAVKAFKAAMELAKKQNRPGRYDLLSLQYASLLCNCKMYVEFLDEIAAVVARADSIRTSYKVEPEIGVEIDDLLSELLDYALTAEKRSGSESGRAFDIAVKYVNALPAVRQDRKFKAYLSALNHYEIRGEWLKVAPLCDPALATAAPNDRILMLCREYEAYKKLNKKADAQRVLDELSKPAGKPNTVAWATYMGQTMQSAKQTDDAMTFYNKAATLLGDPKKFPHGSTAVTSLYSARAELERAIGKIPQAESDARIAVEASKGEAAKELRYNLKLLEFILKMQNKNKEANEVHERIHASDRQFVE